MEGELQKTVGRNLQVYRKQRGLSQVNISAAGVR